jgi:hypothetical protein
MNDIQGEAYYVDERQPGQEESDQEEPVNPTPAGEDPMVYGAESHGDESQGDESLGSGSEHGPDNSQQLPMRNVDIEDPKTKEALDK